MSDFTLWLESELKRRGLSHNELARLSGLSQTGISNVIAGNRKPGAIFCRKVAIALELPPVNLLALAGILPDSTPPAASPLAPSIEDNPQLKEIIDVVKSLPPAKREQALNFLKFLAQR